MDAQQFTSTSIAILRSAVGTQTCDPVCICDANGAGGTTATDALFCLKAAVAEPVDFRGAVFLCSASIGATFYPQEIDLSSAQLLWQADHAMYDAKLAGKNCYRFFDPSKT